VRLVVGKEAVQALLAQRLRRTSPPLPPAVRQRLRSIFQKELSLEEAVARIIRDVTKGGDRAVLRYTRLLDGVTVEDLEVPKEALTRAFVAQDRGLRESLEFAAGRIRRYYQSYKEQSWPAQTNGTRVEVRPLERVGVYIPAGTAPLVSTVLMTVIPARVAGVKEVILASPPGKGGMPASAILAAAAIAGVDRLFSMGGAQAIAALALGTESVPRVDKVCGPGNIFVTLAKKQLFGRVGIDGLFGPTETVIIADDTADPGLCAADLLAQAEHDVLASPLLITTSEPLAKEVQAEVRVQLRDLERRAIATSALRKQGAIILADTVDDAIELANQFAPEHLSLVVRDARSYVPKVRNTGCVFVGHEASEVLGDYVFGPSHVLPTGGTARFASGLGIEDFVKRISIVDAADEELPQLLQPATVIARAEGLTAHARAAEMRLEKARRRL
jgi:histidinol dehydrogenase